MLNFLSGKKTYIVAAIAGVGAVAGALGHPFPDWAWGLINAVGLGALRAAVRK